MVSLDVEIKKDKKCLNRFTFIDEMFETLFTFFNVYI